jgi:hypothetical protein
MYCSPIANRDRPFTGRQNFSDHVTFEGHFKVTEVEIANSAAAKR